MSLVNIRPLANFFNTNKYYNKEKVPLKNILNTNQINMFNINNQNKIKSNPFENCIQKERKVSNNKSIKKKIKSKLNDKNNYSRKHSISQSNFLNYHSSTTNYCIKNIPNFNNTNNSKDNKNSMYNNKKISKNFTCCDIFPKNKLRKKIMLSVSNPNYTNISTLNNNVIETINQKNLITNNNIPFKLTDTINNNDKKSKIAFFNYNKNSNLIKSKNYTQNNSNNNSSNKYIKINNNNRLNIHDIQKRKYNNSQNSIINNNTTNINKKLEKYFYTSYLLNDYSENNNNDKKYNLIEKSTTLNNSQNSKYFKKYKDNFVSNLTTSNNSPKNFLHRSTKNSSLKNYINKKLINTDDIKIKSVSELINNKLIKDINSLESKLNKKLNEQIMISDKYIKYKLFKSYFAKFIKLMNEPILSNIFYNIKNILEIFFNGYNELLINLFSENKIIKEENKNLLEKNQVNQTEILNLRKIIIENQEKMDTIQKKFNCLINERNLFKQNFNNTLNGNKKIFNCNNMIIKKTNICDVKDIQNKRIYEINKENLNDLEALYFFDKIKMENKREISVPILNITRKKKNKKIKPEDKFNLIKQRFENESNEDDEINKNDEIFLIESD